MNVCLLCGYMYGCYINPKKRMIIKYKTNLLKFTSMCVYVFVGIEERRNYNSGSSGFNSWGITEDGEKKK